MKRRAVLAGLGVAGASLFAGCGLAHFGGAIRDESTFPSPERPHLFDRIDDGVVTARSGTQWVRDEMGQMNFTTATSISAVGRSGLGRWEANVEGSSDAMAVGERPYLVGEDRLRAIEPAEEYGTRQASRLDATEIRWELDIPGAGWPIAANAGTVYLRRATDLVCVRDGSVAWSRDRTPQELIAADIGVLVLSGDRVSALDQDGEKRWDADGHVATLDRRRNAVVVRDGEALTYRDIETGKSIWREVTDAGGDAPFVGESVIAVPTGRGITCLDRDTGEQHWHVTAGHRPRPFLVPDDQRVYSATARGDVLCIDDGEITWETHIDGREEPLDGWIDDDRVAFLYDSGTIRWLQRQDQDVPLLV